MKRKQTRGAAGFSCLLLDAVRVIIIMLYLLEWILVVFFRYGNEGCNYLYEIDAHINDMSRLIEGQVRYVIDATKYGNVSRFINHR